MAMISRVGRRHFRVRLTLGAILLLLILGSLTMLYPFGLMLAGSAKSNADINDSVLIPAFLTNEQALWRKHVEAMFGESPQLMRATYNTTAAGFDRLDAPPEPNVKFAQAWVSFLESAKLPTVYYTIGHFRAPVSMYVLPRALRTFRAEVSRKFGGDLDRVNAAMGTDFADWNTFILDSPEYLRRSQLPSRLPLSLAINDFLQRQPLQSRIYFSIEGFYREQFIRQQFPTIKRFNAHHGTQYADFREIHLPRSLPEAPRYTDAERATWETFVRSTLNLLWIRVTPDAAAAYHAFLQARYGGVDALNRGYQSQFASFDQIPLITEPPSEGPALSDWDSFIQGWKDPTTGAMHRVPLEAMRIHCIDFLFQDYLQQRYRSIERCAAQLNLQAKDFYEIQPPQRDLHLMDFREHTGEIRKEFLIRNYLTVWDYLVLHGRAVWNTVVYCALAIAGALIVNPLAAYALSRYRPPSTYKLLLLMMLTMAFPPMVTQIPMFLMMRDLGMLNTYWALLLPGLANGYSIFLLKGFFDSLPQELYESATLDGAGEIRIFWQITMSLSKPILAVVALSAFTAAYSNFMFALLICQDQSMWTLMVWLYQLQTKASEGVILAALTVAAVPTLLVFVLCQRVIIRGIAVPVEK